MENQDPSDSDLLRRTLAGDEEAFTALYRRRQAGVYRFALQMSGSPAIAEEVTQEVFMTLIREGANYDPSRGTLAAYLYGIARNHVLRSLERERLATLTEIPEQPSTAADPLGTLTRTQSIESVRAAVLGLPAHYREVVVLCELHEMGYAEAAAALGCALGTVRSRLHRARELLAERLRPVREANRAGAKVCPARCLT